MNLSHTHTQIHSPPSPCINWFLNSLDKSISFFNFTSLSLILQSASWDPTSDGVVNVSWDENRTISCFLTVYGVAI
jgi:hypothetical protein